MKNYFFDTDVILDISIAREMDIKDSVKYFTAKENNMDCIITRNVNDFKKSIIPVLHADRIIENN